MTQTIEIDEEVFEALGRRARPFIDTTPNDVLRALLALEGLDSSGMAPSQGPGQQALQTPPGKQDRRAKPSQNGGKSRTRAPKGSLLDETAYWVPILQALDEHGGRAAAREVVERVGQLVDDQLKPLDRETLKTGGVRWQTRVQFARLRMKEQGLLAPDAPRGVWEISDAGRAELAKSAPVTAVEGS